MKGRRGCPSLGGWSTTAGLPGTWERQPPTWGGSQTTGPRGGRGMQPPHLGKSKTADAVHIRFRFGSVPQTHQVSMTLSFQLFVSLLASPTGHWHGKDMWLSALIHWLHTPATGEDPLAPPTHRPRAWQSQAVRCSLRSHGHLHMEDPQVESGDLKVLMIVRTLPCGSIHVSVDPFHDCVRPKTPLGRWSSEIRFGSDLGQWWLRFCSALVHDLASVWAHRRFLSA